jgi:hypothetical protein
MHVNSTNEKISRKIKSNCRRKRSQSEDGTIDCLA